MSKHEKTIRRERKKTDRARRLGARFRHPTSHIKHGAAAALAAAAVIAAGTQAYASPLRFDNPPGPGHHQWTRPPMEYGYLDLTLPADLQPPSDMLTSGDAILRSIEFASSVSVDGSGCGGSQVATTGYYILDGLDAGELVGGGLTFQLTGYDYYPGYGQTEIQEGVPAYLGAKTAVGQYGWIGVVLDGHTLDAFAWGYETTPGVAIPAGIPEPGSLALLALGALAVAGRRRA